MKYFKGIIEINNIKVNAIVMFIPPTEYRLGEWSGEGISPNYIEPNQYNTNVGMIIVNNSLCNQNSFFIEFIGSGKFEGFESDNE